MTAGQVYGARRNPATPVDRREDYSPNYYLDWAFDEMRKLVDTFPKSVNESFFVVRTALDPDLQRYADGEAKSTLRQFGHDYGASQTALVIADLDGGVNDGRRTRLWRQPVQSRRRRHASAGLLIQTLRLCDGIGERLYTELHRGRSPVCIGNWCPHNYSGGYSGSLTLTLSHHQFRQHHSGSSFRSRWATAIRSSAVPEDHSDRAQLRHLHAASRYAVAPDRRRCGQCA